MSQPVKVVFSNTNGWEGIHPPAPASSLTPNWYKEMDNYLFNKKAPSLEVPGVSTIKRCVPVFDAMTSGYLIFSSVDVYVHTQKNGQPYYQWPNAEVAALEFHPLWQANKHPQQNGFDVPKWVNYWCVKTPPGYSCLFVSPLHRDLPFEIFSGIVDTDTYSQPVQFPFVLKNPQWEGMIPAGTPIAQVIPFKRSSFKMEIQPNDQKAFNRGRNLFKSMFFDIYRKTSWVKKEFR